MKFQKKKKDQLMRELKRVLRSYQFPFGLGVSRSPVDRHVLLSRSHARGFIAILFGIVVSKNQTMLKEWWASSDGSVAYSAPLG